MSASKGEAGAKRSPEGRCKTVTGAPSRVPHERGERERARRNRDGPGFRSEIFFEIWAAGAAREATSEVLTGWSPSAEEGGQAGLSEGEDGGESDIERVARGEGE